MSKKTQCERIIDYINDFGSITILDAFRDLGCTRLASRICDLKKRGYVFHTEFVTGQNRYGEKVSYKRYRLGEENAGLDKTTSQVG